MCRLSVKGQSVDISEHNFLNAIGHLAEGFQVLAEAYNRLHISGFADLDNAFQMPDVGQGEVIKGLVAQIDDPELHEAFNSLREHLLELEKVDREIAAWLARYVGLSSLRDRRDRARLKKRLHKIIVEGPDGRYQGPVWTMHSEYQTFLERSKAVLAFVYEARRRVDQRIRQLLEGSAEG